MSDLPTWFRIALLSALVLILIGVIVADIESTDYEAQALALALVGVVGTAIGSDLLKRGGKNE